MEQHETDRIKALLEQRNMPVVELAKRIRVSRQRVYAWLSGDAPIPGNRIDDIAEVLGVSPALLRYGDVQIDSERLSAVIATVLERAAHHAITLPVNDTAKIVEMVYSELSQAQSNVPDHSKVDNLIRLAS